MPKVTEEHERKRREQILAAAMECFARNGYRTTSIEDIVRESKLSVGAIYSYFPSKQDLFLALAEQRTTETLEAFRAVYERRQDYPGGDLYWLLLTSGFRTYRFMSVMAE